MRQYTETFTANRRSNELTYLRSMGTVYAGRKRARRVFSCKKTKGETETLKVLGFGLGKVLPYLLRM